MPRKEFTAEFTVEFVPLPPEKEEAYWAAIHYLAEIMFADFIMEATIEEEIKIVEGK